MALAIKKTYGVQGDVWLQGEGWPVPDDWPGLREFAHLGRLINKTVVNDLTVGLFESREFGDPMYYAASSRPHVVGMGSNSDEALADWSNELLAKWDIAKSLRRPFASSVENDVEAMIQFFKADESGTGGS